MIAPAQPPPSAILGEDSRQLAGAALRMAERICDQAEREGPIVCWRTPAPDDGEDRTTWAVREGLYDGVAGIAAVLAEIWVVHGGERLRWAIAGAARFLADPAHHTAARGASLYHGRVGVALVLWRLAALLDDGSLRARALALACTVELTAESPCDLEAGAAGTALGLTWLYQASHAEALLRPLGEALERVVDQADDSHQGLCWDRGPEQVRPLCGAAHGAAGIGLAFTQIGAAFASPAMSWMGAQAFAYERSQFDARRGTWPDYRKSARTTAARARLVEAYHAGDLAVFTEPADNASWCNGAVGAALTRLGATRVAANEVLATEAVVAIDRVRGLAARLRAEGPAAVADRRSLCHGAAGTCDGLVEAGVALRAPALHADALAVARALASTEADAPTASPAFMTGAAGVAYAVLRAAHPARVPLLLLPAMVRAARPHPPGWSAPLLGTSVAELQARIGRARRAHLGIPPRRAAEVEASRRRLEAQMRSQSLAGVRRRAVEERVAALLARLDGAPEDVWLATDPDLRLSPFADDLTVLFRPTPAGILAARISPLERDLLARFTEGASVGEVIDSLLADAALPPGSETRWRRGLAARIRTAVAGGLLLDHRPPLDVLPSPKETS